MNQTTKQFIVKGEEAGDRVDQFLAKKFSGYSRNYFAKLISQENVLVSGKPVKAAYKLRVDDEVQVFIQEVRSNLTPQAEDIQIDIIFEDNDVIVVNKPAGMVVHPGAGNYSGTLVNALLSYIPAIKDAVLDPESKLSSFRPGIVHRLDKDTSGIMVVAKNARAMHSISRQIMHRDVKKLYFALCYGWPKEPEGELTNFIARNPKDRKKMAEVDKEKGKVAISKYRVDKYLKSKLGHKISLVEFNIITGRTHQIRLQSKLAGFPVLGDSVYGSRESQKCSATLSISRQMLHAKELSFTLPGENTASRFVADLPKDFEHTLRPLSEIE